MSIYLFYPFLNNDSIFGIGTGIDPLYCAKIIQLVSQKFAKGISPFHNSFWDIAIYYPSKRALAFSDPFIIPGFFSFIMTNVLKINFILSLNLIFFLNVLFNWFSCYLFFSAIFKAKEYALFGGWLWAFSINLLTQYLHFQNTMAFGIPLCYYSLYQLSQSVKIKYLLLLAISFFILACTNIYNYYFTILSSPIVFSLFVIQSNNLFTPIPAIKKLIKVSLIIPLTLIPSFLISYRYIEVKSFYPEFESQKSLNEILANSIHLIDLISVDIVTPIYDSILPHSLNLEKNALPGLFTIFFANALVFLYIYSLFKKKNIDRRITVSFLAATLLFLIGFYLASGANYFKFSFQFLTEYLPGFKSLRAIGRASILIVMAEIIYSVLFLILIENLFKDKKRAMLCILLFSSLQVIERVIPNYKNFKIDIAKLYAEEKEAIDFLSSYKNKEGAVLEISLENEEDKSSFLVKSLFHKLKLVNGYSAFNLGSHISILDMGRKLKQNEISPDYHAILSITSILLIKSNTNYIPFEMENYLKNYFPMQKNVGHYIIFFK